jgi:hypothetical protein
MFRRQFNVRVFRRTYSVSLVRLFGPCASVGYDPGAPYAAEYRRLHSARASLLFATTQIREPFS